MPTPRKCCLRLLYITLLLVLGGNLSFSISADDRLAENEEAELRELTTRFFRSWEKLDAETHLSLWSKTSEEGVATRARVPKSWEGFDKIELKKLEFRRVLIDGDRATVRITVNFAAIIKRTGKPAGGFMNRDARLSFIFVRTDGRWLVDSWIGTSTELAEAIVKLNSNEEREAIRASLTRVSANTGSAER